MRQQMTSTNISSTKATENFRNYDYVAHAQVVQTYKDMHVNQSLDFVQQQQQHYNTLKYGKFSIPEMFILMNQIIDESDPDSDLPQIIHAYQTAEAVCERYLLDDITQLNSNILIQDLFTPQMWNFLPQIHKDSYTNVTLKQFYSNIQDWSWLPLIGLLHDLGKVISLKQFGGLPQWCVVGDTYPVGAPFSSSNVFFTDGFYKQSADYTQYNIDTATAFGIYPKHTGFSNINMSWGHDEYLYQVMLNGSNLCNEALYLIRFHSFYPWHTPRNEMIGYTELASSYDWHLLPLLKAFQKCDLYSKTPKLPKKNVLDAKYTALMEKYIPNKIIAW